MKQYVSRLRRLRKILALPRPPTIAHALRLRVQFRPAGFRRGGIELRHHATVIGDGILGRAFK
jgi:hypothetical protein